MRLLLIVLLLSPLLCGVSTYAQSLSHADSVAMQYVHQQLDSIKLELQKTESQKLATEARDMRKEAFGQMDAVIRSSQLVVNLIALFLALVSIAVAITGFKLFKTEKEARQTTDDFERRLRPQVESALGALRDEVRSEIDKTKSELRLPESGSKVSDEDMQRLREVDERLKKFEQSGGRLTAEDFVLRGRKFQEDKLYDLALSSFNDAISEDKTNVRAWFGRGLCLGRLGRYEEAIQAYNVVLEKFPNDYATLFNKGFDLVKLKRVKEVTEIAEILYGKAKAFANIHDEENFYRALSDAIELHPDYHDSAKRDSAFKDYWNDQKFIEIVSELPKQEPPAASTP
jgi:tetratricopeptide (TPR) repeat protein